MQLRDREEMERLEKRISDLERQSGYWERKSQREVESLMMLRSLLTRCLAIVNNEGVDDPVKYTGRGD